MEGEIESMACNMRSKMRNDTVVSSKPCIFRIPSILRRHNNEAYIPNAFSIGPFHHAKQDLKATEKIKFNYLQGLVERTNDPDTTLKKCIREIRNCETDARQCYAEEIGMSQQEFIEMLVLDGCFIIELFRKDAEVIPKDENDPIFSMSCMLQFLYHDLILLENQIPWFVLQLLFDLTRGLSESMPLIQLALDFFDYIFSSERSPIHPDLFGNQEINHILDLLRSSLVLPLGEGHGQEESQSGSLPFPSATIIKECGIRFRKVSSPSILDVRFTRGAIEMPSILIQETVEPVFRNLISYEQCYPNCSPRITSYAILLDNLINTAEDMDELCRSGIIINWLNPQDAAQFFRMLYHDAFVKEFYYQKLCGEVNRHRQKLWPKWRAFYIHNYFGKPWAIVSQVVAAILLALAVLQTLYSMK